MKKFGFLLIFMVFFLSFLEAGVFNVSNPEELQNALKTSQSNGEDDTIYVAPGTYNITQTLTYITRDGDGSLTIEGQDPNNLPILDGGKNVQIMSIDNDYNCDEKGDTGVITIRGIIFKNGIYDTTGGALDVWTGEADIVIEKCIFIENQSTGNPGNYEGYGGGANLETSSGKIIISNCIFTKNTASGMGGGVDVDAPSGKVILKNNIFSGNHSDVNGGGAEVTSRRVILTNNTITGNTSNLYGGGIFLNLPSDSGEANIFNNIIWGNTANYGGNDGDDLYIYSSSVINLYNNDLGENSDFQTGKSEDLYITNTTNYSQDKNIKEDPIFLDPANDDFHLKDNSPCIDKGENSAPEIPQTDFEGDERIINGIVDIGADEYVIKKKGDLNGDGGIDISDVILCLRQAIGLDPVDRNLADMNGDGEVDILDVILILRKAIGLDQ